MKRWLKSTPANNPYPAKASRLPMQTGGFPYSERFCMIDKC